MTSRILHFLDVVNIDSNAVLRFDIFPCMFVSLPSLQDFVYEAGNWPCDTDGYCHQIHSQLRQTCHHRADGGCQSLTDWLLQFETCV